MKVYIGDSVYAEFEGDNIILTTENSSWPSNKIVLEPAVWGCLLFAVKSWKKKMEDVSL